MIQIKSNNSEFNFELELDQVIEAKSVGCPVDYKLDRLNQLNNLLLNMLIIDADEWIKNMKKIVAATYMEVDDD